VLEQEFAILLATLIHHLQTPLRTFRTLKQSAKPEARMSRGIGLSWLAVHRRVTSASKRSGALVNILRQMLTEGRHQTVTHASFIRTFPGFLDLYRSISHDSS
jgi:hypothetical protein